MHDVIAHNLSVMIVLADGATYAVHDDPDARRRRWQRIDDGPPGVDRDAPAARRPGRRARGDDRAPQPGLVQIDPLIEQVRLAGLPVALSVGGAPEHVPPGMQLTAYRIVQEALTNARKHAGPGAEAFNRALLRGPPVRGPDTRRRRLRSRRRPPRAGLVGMRERVAVYDGTLEAGPSSGGGWRVRPSSG